MFQYILLQKSIYNIILFLYLSVLRNVKTAMLFNDQRVVTLEVFAKPCQYLKQCSAVLLCFDVSYINQLQQLNNSGGIASSII